MLLIAVDKPRFLPNHMITDQGLAGALSELHKIKHIEYFDYKRHDGVDVVGLRFRLIDDSVTEWMETSPIYWQWFCENIKSTSSASP